MSLLRKDFLISGAEGLENEIIAWPTSRRAILLNIFLPRINRRWPGEEGEGGFPRRSRDNVATIDGSSMNDE